LCIFVRLGFEAVKAEVEMEVEVELDDELVNDEEVAEVGKIIRHRNGSVTVRHSDGRRQTFPSIKAHEEWAGATPEERMNEIKMGINPCSLPDGAPLPGGAFWSATEYRAMCPAGHSRLDGNSAEPSAETGNDAPPTVVVEGEPRDLAVIAPITDAVRRSMTAFDYGAIPPEHAAELKESANRIRKLRRHETATIIAIGKELIEAKERLDHGQFYQWLGVEVGIAPNTGWRYMRVAQLAEKSSTVEDFSPTALYELGAPSTPDEVREAILEPAEAGDVASAGEIRSAIRQVKAGGPRRHHHLDDREAALSEAAALLIEHVDESERERLARLGGIIGGTFEEVVQRTIGVVHLELVDAPCDPANRTRRKRAARAGVGDRGAGQSRKRASRRGG
jgi:hypothetical protein